MSPQFQPFSERITNLDIDIFHRVGHKNEEIDSERETYFYQTIVKWNGLNSSESYNELCKELTHHVKILPQLIAQKDKLVSTLMKYLQLKNEFSLEPTLEWVTSIKHYFLGINFFSQKFINSYIIKSICLFVSSRNFDIKLAYTDWSDHFPLLW